MSRKLTNVALGLVLFVLPAPIFAADNDPPASSEVTAAMQPYLDHYKLAGVIGIIADKDGKVHYKNLLGYADVEAKKPIREDNVFWIASMSKMFVGASIMRRFSANIQRDLQRAAAMTVSAEDGRSTIE